MGTPPIQIQAFYPNLERLDPLLHTRKHPIMSVECTNGQQSVTCFCVLIREVLAEQKNFVVLFFAWD
jgi:hypothetical protein